MRNLVSACILQLTAASTLWAGGVTVSIDGVVVQAGGIEVAR